MPQTFKKRISKTQPVTGAGKPAGKAHKPVKKAAAVPQVAVERPQVPVEPVFNTDSRTRIRWDLFIGGAVVTAIIVVLTGGLWWGYQTRFGLAVEPADVPAPTPVPTPSPAPQWSRAAITVSVLNASGESGLAATVASKAEAQGYRIGRVGNAAKQTESTLTLTGDIASIAAQLTADMGGFVGREVTVSSRNESGMSKVVLTIGARD